MPKNKLLLTVFCSITLISFCSEDISKTTATYLAYFMSNLNNLSIADLLKLKSDHSKKLKAAMQEYNELLGDFLEMKNQYEAYWKNIIIESGLFENEALEELDPYGATGIQEEIEKLRQLIPKVDKKRSQYWTMKKIEEEISRKIEEKRTVYNNPN